MKIITTLIAFMLFLSGTTYAGKYSSKVAKAVTSKISKKETKHKKRRIKSRVTYYHKFQDGGNQVAMCSKMKPKEGVTIAAHPDFKFGSVVTIPALRGVIGNGEFIVQDRGSAVTSKKASRGKYYVFDVFIDAPTRKEANQKLRKMQQIIDDYMFVEL